MNIQKIAHKNFYNKNNIQFKNQYNNQSNKQSSKEQLAKDFAIQIVNAGVASETISEINKLMVSKQLINSKINLANALSNSAMQPLKEGVDLKVLEYHKTVQEFIGNKYNSKFKNITKKLEKNGVTYTYQNGTAEYPDVVVMRSVDKNSNEIQAYAYHNPDSDKYDYRFRNFILTKNFNYADAIIQNDKFKTLQVHGNFWSPIGFAYKFNDNNQVQIAKTLVFSSKKSEEICPAAFSFDDNGKVKNIIIAPKNDGSDAYYNREVELDKFTKKGDKVLYLGTVLGKPSEVEKYLNF